MTSERAEAAARATFPARTITKVTDLNKGRGVFSEVARIEFADAEHGPRSIAVKLGVEGPNGDAARRSGAYEREAVAYRALLPHLEVVAPTCHAVIDDPLGATFVLEDLSSHRAVDQLDGLSADDAVAVATALGRLHRSAQRSPDIGRAVADAALRTNTVASLDPAALRLGLAALEERWQGVLDARELAAFARLVDAHEPIADRFANAGPTVLCHGDPRADNLVFRADGAAVLFDWQQIARQPGVGDLAWLLATSLEPAVRTSAEARVLAAYRAAADVTIDDDDARAGFALPGLAVLYLAQRQADDARTAALIATSLRRIGRALIDLDVPGLAGS